MGIFASERVTILHMGAMPVFMLDLSFLLLMAFSSLQIGRSPEFVQGHGGRKEDVRSKQQSKHNSASNGGMLAEACPIPTLTCMVLLSLQ